MSNCRPHSGYFVAKMEKEIALSIVSQWIERFVNFNDFIPTRSC